MLPWKEEQGSQHSLLDNFCLLQHYKNTTGVIYVQRARGITFYDHSLRFKKSAEKNCQL